jgi:hypothetical protein
VRLAARARCAHSCTQVLMIDGGGPAGLAGREAPAGTHRDGRGHSALAPPAHSGRPGGCSPRVHARLQLGAVTNTECGAPGPGPSSRRSSVEPGKITLKSASRHM